MLIRRLSFVLVCIFCFTSAAHALTQQEPASRPVLTVEKIMQDPKWMGPSPRSPYWSEDGKWIYFMWNPEKAESDSLYKVSRSGGTPQKVSMAERKAMPSRSGEYNRAKTKKVYQKNGDIFLLDIRNGKIRQITDTVGRESNPDFSLDEKKITIVHDNNLFVWNMENGETIQLTDFRKGKKKPEKKKPGTEQEKWLVEQQKELIRILVERKERSDLAKERRELEQPSRPKEIYIEDKSVRNIQLSPDEKFVTFRLAKQPKNAKRTIVPNYVTESGFSEDINARTKVGSPQTSYELGIYHIDGDTVYFVSTEEIPGIFDKPEYLKDYEKTAAPDTVKEKKNGKRKPRGAIVHGPYWSDDGEHAVLVFRAQDNKDRWILALDASNGEMKLLDRQHDDAWVAGPGIGSGFGPGSVGWMPDNRRFWFQSEETGYSHLYAVDVTTGEKDQLTSGRYEVFSPRISKDKKSWHFTSSEVHPGERHLYKMPVNGGRATKITTMAGSNQANLSPDDKSIAIRHSYSNRPWELFVMDNKPGAKLTQITHSLSEEFSAYPWRDPEIVTFTAEDGTEVPARLYRPDNPEANGPAVVFVHGAGYLQNVHRWWSSYFREYMFHNLLVDNGYTVLDIDYRGSAGYGRDWRTAIYRFMGGKDLSDQVDGAKFLVEKYDVDPKRIGIYGGSYGGFITFMAMFTTPDVFAAGAALRPVSDWAHYNHPYTSNILNTPVADSLAYIRSSPIYHAQGLKGALLICVGMIDTNVHFQDVVRVVQRLIELGKENWETAVYPVESHGFREPSSWTDEYKRIFKLFEENLK